MVQHFLNTSLPALATSAEDTLTQCPPEASVLLMYRYNSYDLHYRSMQTYSSCLPVLPYGLVVRIPPFHGGGPGSIPGVGTSFSVSQI